VLGQVANNLEIFALRHHLHTFNEKESATILSQCMNLIPKQVSGWMSGSVNVILGVLIEGPMSLGDD